MSKRLLMWAAVVGACGLLFTALIKTSLAVTNFTKAVELAPQTSSRVDRIEQWMERMDEKSDSTQYWVAAIGKKLGVPAPPPRGRPRASGGRWND